MCLKSNLKLNKLEQSVVNWIEWKQVAKDLRKSKHRISK